MQASSGPSTELELAGDFDIAKAAQLKEQLSQALGSGGDVYVSMAGVSALDITSFQLLWAAARVARSHGRAFRLNTPIASDVLARLTEAGLPCAALLEDEA